MATLTGNPAPQHRRIEHSAESGKTVPMTWIPQLNTTGLARRGRRHIRASLVDWRFAGLPVGVVAGPFDVWPGTALDILNRMADLGPDYRVCVKPDTERRRWQILTPDASWMLPEGLCVPNDVEVSLARCFAHRPVGAVAVRVSDRFVFLRFDHGLGDAFVMMEILAAFTGNQPHPDGFGEPRPTVDTRHPVPEAIVRSIVGNPGQHMRVVRNGLQALRSRQAIRSGEQSNNPAGIDSAQEKVASEATPSSLDPGAVQSVVVRSAGDFLEDLKELRGQIGRDRITIAALLAHRITDAFAVEIPRLADTVGVVVDLRRCLPPGRGTLSNVNAVAAVPFTADPATFGTAYTAAVNAPTLPARLGMALARARLHARLGKVATTAGTVGPVGLSISDLTRHPTAAKLAWTSQPGDGGHTFGIALPPGGPNSIAVAVTQVGAEMNLTATFYSNCVESDAVRRALQSALTITTQRTGRT